MWGCGTELKTRLFYLKSSDSARLIPPRRCKSAQYRCVETSVRVQCSATEVTLPPADLLLDWIANHGALQPDVVVDGTASTAGRRLMTTGEQVSDDVLISVPLSAVFADLQVCCEPLTDFCTSRVESGGICLPHSPWK